MRVTVRGGGAGVVTVSVVAGSGTVVVTVTAGGVAAGAVGVVVVSAARDAPTLHTHSATVNAAATRAARAPRLRDGTAWSPASSFTLPPQAIYGHAVSAPRHIGMNGAAL